MVSNFHTINLCFNGFFLRDIVSNNFSKVLEFVSSIDFPVLSFNFIRYYLDACHERDLLKEICKPTLSACSIGNSTCLMAVSTESYRMARLSANAKQSIDRLSPVSYTHLVNQ